MHSSICPRLNRILLCGVACFAVSGTLLALLRPERATNVSQQTLTFAERVAYQRRHRGRLLASPHLA